MALRERWLPRTQQPQEAVRLSSVWAADLLWFVHNGPDLGGAAAVATGETRSVTPHGIGLSVPSSGQMLLSRRLPAGEITVAAAAIWDNSSGLKYLVGTNYDGANLEPVALRLSDSTAQLTTYYPDTRAEVATTGIAPGSLVLVWGVLGAEGVGAPSEVGVIEVATGRLFVGTNGSHTPTARAGADVYVGSGANMGTPWRRYQQPILWAAAWSRRIPQTQWAALRDPWQVFEPQRIWVPVSAGGGGATPQTLSSSLSLAVQVARSATASLGLAVQAPASATASVTLAVQQALTAQASLGTAVQLARTAAASLDTAVQTARSASTGTSLAVQAPASAVLSADIAVQQASSASASVDAYVQAATQLVASLDLLVQEGHALSVALEVAVQAARTGTSSVDLAVQAARAASTGVDTAVQQARSAAASVGLAVQAARAAGASVDLYVQAGFALVAGLDVAVRFAASAAASVDLAVATARSASVQIGAAVAVQQVLGAAMQAAVRASAVATCGVGLYVDDPAALVHSAAPLVPRVQGAARRAAVQSVIRAAAGQRTRR